MPCTNPQKKGHIMNIEEDFSTEAEEPSLADAIGFPCTQCGAQTAYDPASSTLLCPYCHTKHSIPSNEVEAPEYIFYPEDETFTAPVWSEKGNRRIVCSSCGADITVSAAAVTATCPFCSGHYVTELDDDDKIIKPETMVPFKISRDAACASYTRWAKKRFFAPSAFRRAAAKAPSMNGVYIPHWTYDADMTTSFSGWGGRHRIVHYTVRVNGKTQHRTKTVTDWYKIGGVENLRFDDTLCCASRKIDRALLAKLGPFSLKVLNVYNPAYLAGFFAERYDIGLSEGFSSVIPTFEGNMERHIFRVSGYDEYRAMSYQHTYTAVRFKHILLPVFMSTFQYGGKSYPFLVNGENGLVAGKAPISPLKVALAILAGSSLFALAMWLLYLLN